ncbi:MAG TPA: class I SAM-dependent methyltransferase [Bacteroidia bacterium]|nr:class I SAM-dependent methyltransferase [Bacteroidia bacterium]
MSLSYRIKSYLRYRKKTVSKHGVHSPFVFELVSKVFPDRGHDYSEHIAEDWRTECDLDQSTIDVHDLGTGKSGPRKVFEIAEKSANSPAHGQLLHRILRRFRPKRMLELGTSLGITSMYQAKATHFDKFISLEGCPNTASIAKKGFDQHKLDIEIRVGNFDATLKDALNSLEKVDYIFFDGNHREEPTLRYFETCLPYVHNDTLFIFDDIHWSKEMDDAWEKIKQHPKVRLTIDIYHFGLVFFRSEQKEKEHFVLRF